MTLADLDQVMAIEKASFPTPWPIQAFINEIYRKRNSICWVAETEEEFGPIVAGLIVIWLTHDKGHIGTLSTHPGYRGQGIANYLLAESLLACLKRGVNTVDLEVREGNQIAQNLYLKFGFRITDKRSGYYEDTHEDAYVMTLSPLEEEKLVELAHSG
jgi:ribosomal-protein-alanine N-acetyltransferase